MGLCHEAGARGCPGCSLGCWGTSRILLIWTIRKILMTDLEYLDHAERALKSIELSCDRLNETTDADVDNQRVGGMITLTFANRSQIVVNLQKPLHEIWLAARQGGYHFRCDDAGQWRCTKTGVELFALLSQAASDQAGTPLAFG